MLKTLSAGLAAIVLLLPAASLRAHDFWIEPENFMPEPGEDVLVSLREGVGFKGNTLPYITDWFRDFSLVNADGRVTVESILGNDPAATITGAPGAQLLGYNSRPVFVELKAKKFNSYLEEEGIEFIKAERERRGETDLPAPENFIRCAKALVQTGPADDEIYRTRLGYKLELMPQANPYLAAPGDTLDFQLLYDDAPIEGRLIQAFSRETPDAVQKIWTDENGMASIRLDRPGVWLVKAVQIIPVIGRPQTIPGKPPALWQSYWASFLFEVPGS